MPLHPDFQKILDQFKARYGNKKGTSVFYAWINKRKLDYTKAYSQAQLQRRCQQIREKLCSCSQTCDGTGPCKAFESFQWAKPLIKLFKQDNEAKYYQVEAHFAVTSMNNRIYTLEEILQAVHTLPAEGTVDLNHVADWIMPTVDIMAANFEDGAAECIIRVPNGTKDAKGRDVQGSIDSGEIDCVSVEVEADIAVQNLAGETELRGMKYTGLALLDQDALPGIPLTRIMPLEYLAESIFSEVEKLDMNCQEVRESLSGETKPLVEAPEAFAKFCPLCGGTLQNSACVNSGCAGYGKRVDMTIDSLAKANSQLAVVTEEVVRLTKWKGELEGSNETLREQVSDLAQKLSAETTENLKIPMLKERVEGLEQKVIALQTERSVLRGKNEEYADINAKHEKNVNRLELKVQKLEEELGKEQAETELLARQLNEESVKRATAEQKCLNETNDASRIKQMNAKLLEEKAVDIRKISELSDALSENAKKVLAAEQALASARAEVKKRDDIIAENQKTIEKALLDNKRVYKVLKANGIYEVDGAGNLIIPP